MERLRTLRESDKAEVAAIWKALFGDSDAFIEWFFSERYRPETSVCLTIDGKIASVMQGCPMTLRLHGKEVLGMMISGVSTLPEYRKRGLMRRVMREMMQLARRSGCAVVFDKPQNLPTFFSLGHLPCTDTLHYVSTADAPEPPWSEDFDIPRLNRCYQAASAHYSGIVVRNEAEFALKMRDYRSDGARILAIEDGGEISAYCVGFLEEDGVRCEEVLARRAEDYPRILALLPKGSAAKLPPDAPVKGEIRPQNVMGAADVPKLLSLLVADESFTVSVHDPVVPENNGIFDGCGHPTARTPLLETSAGELMQMLSGYRPLLDRLPVGACYCVDEY